MMASPIKTESEEVFEHFLKKNNLSFEKIPVASESRPDYLVHLIRSTIVFEVKELVKDKEYGLMPNPLNPALTWSRRVPGERIRTMIRDARRQIQHGVKDLKLPSVLLIYNRLDPSQRFATDDHDFAAAYGNETLLMDIETKETSGVFHGANSSLKGDKNTSFSALARLFDFRRLAYSQSKDEVTVTLFENPFAKIKIQCEDLPECFQFKRSVISPTNVASRQ